MRSKHFLGIALLSLLVSGVNILSAQTSNELDDLMKMSLEDLLNVSAVSGVRHEQRIIDSPRSISVITAEEIRKKNYRSTPEALNELVGILIQETNYGGGSPIIRGLIGNQILILIDGIRLNNAIFRLGPNQYLNTIDLNQIERIEIVRGPGSVLYGSDALGGLINIITKSRKDYRKDIDIGVRFYSRYASVDRAKIGRIDLSGNIKKMGITGGFSYKKFGDLRAGTGTGLQLFTGYDEWDVDLKMNLELPKRQNILVGLQKVTQSNLPRTDKLISGSDLKNEWDPEGRDLVYAQYEVERINSFLKDLHTGFSYQNQLEDLYIINSSKPKIQQEHHNEVRSVGFTFQLSSTAGKHQLLTYGAEYYSDHVDSRRVDVDITTGMRTSKNSTFANGSTYRSLAGFLQDEIQVMKPLSLTLGLRYSSFNAKATLADSLTDTIQVHSTPTALTASARALYKLTENFVVTFGVGQGFRAPNIDDLSILGSFGSGFEVPNPNLKPEQNINYEIGLKAQHRKFTGSLYYFLSNYRDIIDRGFGTFNNLPFLDNNSNGIQDPGEQSVFQRKNIGKARIRGVEAEGQIQILPTWTILGNLAWIRGDNLADNTPLRRIPPIKGKFGIEGRLKKNLWAECYNLFATKQDRLAPGDQTDPRIPIGGTPGFLTYNIRGGLDLNRFGNVTVSWENITNKAYRLHGSGIDGPGTNLVVGYELIF